MTIETINYSKIDFGGVVERTDIVSVLAPFHHFSEYKTVYPSVVINALAALYMEYNKAFTSLVARNREHVDDYCYNIHDGMPVNHAVQIDMIGLTPERLNQLAMMPLDEVKEILRTQIFEIENSLAMYQLLSKIGEIRGITFFAQGFRTLLASLRKKHRKQIALLAVTDEKYSLMCETEFGAITVHPSDEEVYSLTGFDRFFSPQGFQDHIKANNGECEYMLYVRASDPVCKLRNPKKVIVTSLLEDDILRAIIKKNALTFNVDAPSMGFDQKINDTKMYQPDIGMGYIIEDMKGLTSDGFYAFLKQRGAEGSNVRAKPVYDAYGCYGHLTIDPNLSRHRRKVKEQIKVRGPYVLQPEMPQTFVINSDDGKKYSFIDRVFFAFVDGNPTFIGGFHSILPADSEEVKHGRNHGNGSTVWAEIVS